MARSDSNSDSGSPKRRPPTPHEKKWNRPTRPSKHDKGFVPPAPTIAPAWTQSVKNSLNNFNANKDEKKHRIIEGLRTDNEMKNIFDAKARKQRKDRKAAEAANRAAIWAAKERNEQQGFVVAQEDYRVDNPDHFSKEKDRKKDDKKLKKLREQWFGRGGQGSGPGRAMAPGGNQDLRQQASLNLAQMSGALPVSAEEATQSGQSERGRNAAGQAGYAGPSQRQGGPSYVTVGGPGGSVRSAGSRNQALAGQGGHPRPSRQSQEEVGGTFRGPSTAPSQQRRAIPTSSERNMSFKAPTGSQGTNFGPSQQRRPSASASEKQRASKSSSTKLPQLNIQKAAQATAGGVRGSASPSNAAEQRKIEQHSKDTALSAQSSQNTVRSNQTANYKIGNMARTVVEGLVPGMPTGRVSTAARPTPARNDNSMPTTVASSSPTKMAPTEAYKMGNMARTVVEGLVPGMPTGRVSTAARPMPVRMPATIASSSPTKVSAPTAAYKMGNMARTVVEGLAAKSIPPAHLRGPTAAASGSRKEGRLAAPEDTYGSLPPGWEAKKNAQGVTHYVDKNTSSTHWNPPHPSQR